MATSVELGSLPPTLRYARPDGRYSISIEHWGGPIFEVHEHGYADDESGRELAGLFGRLLDAVEADGRYAEAHLCVDYSTYGGSSAATRMRMLREVVARPTMGCTAFHGAPWWTRTVANLLNAVVPRLRARHFAGRDPALEYLCEIAEEDASLPRRPPPLVPGGEQGGPTSEADARRLIRHYRALREDRRSGVELPSDVQSLQTLVRRQHERLVHHDLLLDLLLDSIAQVSSFDACVPTWFDTGDAPEDEDFWTIEGALHLMRTDLAQMFAERDRQAEELVAARLSADEANSAKSHFLAVVSHELRTPLNAIVGLSTLLADDARDDPLQRRRIDGIATASRRLGRLVEDLLDFTRLEAGALKLDIRPFDLRAVLQDLDDVWRPRVDAQRLRLDIEPLPEPLWVRGEPDRLGQVLGNLIDNAIKFTERGVVRLCVEREPDGATRFEVRDTGRGIAAADIDRVFARFEQSDQPRGQVTRGVGLGLTICRHLVDLMGGELSVESEIGHGTSFELVLALPDTTEDTSPSVAPAVHRLTWPGARVLVVEDDPLSRFVARGMLERFGCRVTLAEDGQQGLEAWGREEFDLIFMDCQLPELDGFEATRAIRAAGESGRPRTPIVAMTAYALDSDRGRAEAAGMDGFLVKPVAPDQLGRTLVEHLPSSLRERRAPSSPTSNGDGRRPAPPPELDPRALSTLFDGTTPQLLRRLRKAHGAGDGPESGRIAHLLKGQAATLGAEVLRAACERFEEVGQEPGGDAVLETIAVEVRRVGDALRKAAADVAGGDRGPGEGPGARGRLMLLDDDPVVRALSGRALERWGFEVEAVGHPFEALELFRDAPRPFDAVILDLHLPEMSGLEVLDAMRGMDPDVRAILCSGERVGSADLPQGAAFMAKPMRAGDLVALLDQLRDQPRPVAAGSAAQGT